MVCKAKAWSLSNSALPPDTSLERKLLQSPPPAQGSSVTFLPMLCMALGALLSRKLVTDERRGLGPLQRHSKKGPSPPNPF